MTDENKNLVIDKGIEANQQPVQEQLETGENWRGQFDRVQKYCLDEDHLVSRILSKIEFETNVTKRTVLQVIEILLALVLLLGEKEQQQAISACLTVIYPVHVSVTYLIYPPPPDEDAGRKLLFYWVIYATFENMESYTSLLPAYWSVKTLFLLCVYLPPINLVSLWDEQWIKPLACLTQKKLKRDVMLKAHPYLLEKIGFTQEMVTKMPAEVDLNKPPPQQNG